jgi:hypothetical protein
MDGSLKAGGAKPLAINKRVFRANLSHRAGAAAPARYFPDTLAAKIVLCKVFEHFIVPDRVIVLR